MPPSKKEDIMMDIRDLILILNSEKERISIGALKPEAVGSNPA